MLIGLKTFLMFRPSNYSIRRQTKQY